MATSHRSPPRGTCHTDLSVENKKHKRTYTIPEHRTFEERRGGWEVNKRQNLRATRAKLRGNGLNAHAQHDHLLTTGYLRVNYDY